jgi:hypothetical protein
MTAAGLVAGLLMQAAKPITVYFVALDTFHGVFVQTVFVGAAGVFVYLGICYMLHLEELRSLIHAFDRRILRRFRPEEGGPVGNDGQVL